jgi:3-hydroxyacyl-CoA dehydrogenase
MSANAIKKVCVIGSGVMGAGIAAQVANAGIAVLLLDIVPKDGSRNSVEDRPRTVHVGFGREVD